VFGTASADGLRLGNFSRILAALAENFPPETLHYLHQSMVKNLPEPPKERWSRHADQALMTIYRSTDRNRFITATKDA
jgi:hypothetical protein